MTYRERREARAERLRGWAESRDAKAAARLGSAEKLADSIPFGQPILVGHHSERRARRDQDRIHNGFAAGLAHQRKAEEMRSKADNIEAAADHAIYSDDEDAIERLAERIEALEAERARVKAYNASCRKGTPDRSILTDSERRNLEVVERVQAYALTKGGGFPTYHSANLSGNINRQKKRLAQLQAQRERA